MRTRNKRLDKIVADIIRKRMVFNEGLMENKKHIFSAFTMADARTTLKYLKKTYPYLWKTRKKYSIKYTTSLIAETIIIKRKL